MVHREILAQTECRVHKVGRVFRDSKATKVGRVGRA